MTEKIRQLIDDLDWNKPQGVQNVAMGELSKCDEEELILIADLSICKKSCMANAALILKSIGYPRIRHTFPYLLQWFQDWNWPGVDTIRDLLKEVDKGVLLPYLKSAAEGAIEEEDTVWCYWLVELFGQLDVDASMFQDDKLYACLIELKKREDEE